MASHAILASIRIIYHIHCTSEYVCINTFYMATVEAVRAGVDGENRRGAAESSDSTWLTSTSCFIISAVFAGILAEVANVLDKDWLHASVSVQGCGGD